MIVNAKPYEIFKARANREQTFEGQRRFKISDQWVEEIASYY